ncbi:MAG: sporulation protein [Bacillota bacterium]
MVIYKEANGIFKRLLASIGVNAARVDLELDKDQVRLGETVKGKITVTGGGIEQRIDGIKISLVVTSRFKHDDQMKTVQQEVAYAVIDQPLVVGPEHPQTEIPVQFRLPYHIPLSTGKTRYHFETSLDIKSSVDPKDVDDIVVIPSKEVQMLFDAFSTLGFRLRTGSGEYNGRYQRFEFIPSSFMAGKLDEIELFFESLDDRINILMQLDKKVTGIFSGIIDDLDLDERNVALNLAYSKMTDKDSVCRILRGVIEKEYERIMY